MNKKQWNEYSYKFSILAEDKGYLREDIDGFLAYAQNLFQRGLPIIFDQKHLAMLLGFKYEYVLKISNSPQHFYRTFKIPKKSGGEREISEPLPDLKEIQRWVLDEILNKIRVSPYAKAYVHNRSIRDNAKFHVGQKKVLTIDIKNFFPSLRFEDVNALFLRIGYSMPVAVLLSSLCCLEGEIPQGAPTSPALSNILMTNVDQRISAFTRTKEIRYTRYSDDMTFSGEFETGMLVKFVRSVLRDVGLRIKYEKLRVRIPGQRQEVTGVIVNEKIQAPREMRKKLRQSVYYIQKYGLTSHLEKTENARANHIYHLLGIANFILFLNPEDQEARGYIEILRRYLPTRG